MSRYYPIMVQMKTKKKPTARVYVQARAYPSGGTRACTVYGTTLRNFFRLLQRLVREEQKRRTGHAASHPPLSPPADRPAASAADQTPTGGAAAGTGDAAFDPPTAPPSTTEGGAVSGHYTASPQSALQHGPAPSEAA